MGLGISSSWFPLITIGQLVGLNVWYHSQRTLVNHEDKKSGFISEGIYNYSDFYMFWKL